MSYNIYLDSQRRSDCLISGLKYKWRKTHTFDFFFFRKVDEINCVDIFRAIQAIPHCDFLTNSGLGIPLQSEVDLSRTHPAA